MAKDLKGSWKGVLLTDAKISESHTDRNGWFSGLMLLGFEFPRISNTDF